jgi:L-arabinose isomerase
MIKAFDNCEIWWVTGAQLLYGGDAVVAVDGHSKEMVEGLNNSGIIPIKVVYKGTANSSKEVEDVMKALADNYTVTVSPTYGDAAALGCVWNDLVATPKK